MITFKQNIIHQLNEFYSGEQWVTENFQRKVAILDARTAMNKVKFFNHTICEIVNHMTAWRYFAVKKLNGDAEFDIIDNTAADWPEIDSWELTLNKFFQSQQDLISGLNHFSDDRWYDTVPGRPYDFAYLANGILQHDYYHYGQIGCLIAAQQKDF